LRGFNKKKKEVKKLLLVAVSVGIFLIIIIGAAILILTPKVQQDNTAFSSSMPVPAGRTQPSNADPSEFLRNSDRIMGIQPPPVTDIEVLETNTTVESVTRDRDRLTVNVLKPTTEAAPNASELSAPAVNKPAATATPAKPAVKPAEKPAVKPVASTTSKPMVKTDTASRPTQVAKPAPEAKSAPTAKPVATASAKTRNDYWVQTGAFTAIIRAEDAKETLASKGITSIIENRQIDGLTWYRVRLGPYTSENEAKYWLALVQSIDGFAGSQVRQTPSMQ
jgi:DedD protein